MATWCEENCLSTQVGGNLESESEELSQSFSGRTCCWRNWWCRWQSKWLRQRKWAKLWKKTDLGDKEQKPCGTAQIFWPLPTGPSQQWAPRQSASWVSDSSSNEIQHKLLSRAKIDVCNTTLTGLSKLELTEVEVLRDNGLESMDVRWDIFTFWKVRHFLPEWTTSKQNILGMFSKLKTPFPIS